MINKNSTIKELYQTPIGKDVIDKILMQMNKSDLWIKNPLVSHLKLKHLNRFIKDNSFIETLIELVNQEPTMALQSGGQLKKAWWKEIVFYQIYPRSFCDSNGDGLGDLQGILSKLDYIQTMGFGGIWLSPIFESPMKDNGYDISNYYEINPEMGTMADLKALIAECKKRNLRLILDLVVNHTSDQHPWFKEALNDATSDKRNYYFFRNPDDINNWVSFFYEDAWKTFEAQNISALHLFASEQFDLNWDNPAVRDEVVKIIDFYANLGIDGFRLDVINYISKKTGLPEGNQWIGELMEFRGVEHYFFGPKLNQYLHEINQRSFKPHQLFSIGETPGIGIQLAKLLSADYREELDLIFNFDHLETPGHVRYDDYRYDLNFYKKYLYQWQTSLSNHDWMALFFENHDNPRMISKVNPAPQYQKVLGKLLGMLLLTMKGTPFIYQGQEAGFINQNFTQDELRDVEVLNKLKQSSLQEVLAGTRDHARTMMKWDNTETHAWIKGQHSNIDSIQQQLDDKASVLNFYKNLIELRNKHHSLVYSDVNFKYPYRNHYYGVERNEFYIECNLSEQWIKREVDISNYHLVLSNYSKRTKNLRPYEANLYIRNSK